MKGFLSILEVAAKYKVSESTARLKLSPYADKAKPVKANRHVTHYFPATSVREAFGKEPK